MYEVGQRALVAFASDSAAIIDPRKLPAVLRRPAGRVVIVAGRLWVLHRILIVRVALALMLLAGAGGLFQVRDGLARIGGATAGLISGEFAVLGFGISEIAISGQGLTPESAILAALGIGPATSTLDFDADAALVRLEALPAIATASIRKVYPDRLVVKVVEKTAVARWRIDGVTSLIEANGDRIGGAGAADQGLALIIGGGAADDALVMIRQLDRHQRLARGLIALSRIADRRWDLIYDNGLRVQLPEKGVAQALNVLEFQQTSAALLDRDVDLIDLRVPGTITVRLAKRGPEEGTGGTDTE